MNQTRRLPQYLSRSFAFESYQFCLSLQAVNRSNSRERMKCTLIFLVVAAVCAVALARNIPDESEGLEHYRLRRAISSESGESIDVKKKQKTKNTKNSQKRPVKTPPVVDTAPVPSPEQSPLDPAPIPSPDGSVDGLAPVPSPEQGPLNPAPIPSPDGNVDGLAPVPSPDETLLDQAPIVLPDGTVEDPALVLSPDANADAAPIPDDTVAIDEAPIPAPDDTLSPDTVPIPSPDDSVVIDTAPIPAPVDDEELLLNPGPDDTAALDDVPAQPIDGEAPVEETVIVDEQLIGDVVLDETAI